MRTVSTWLRQIGACGKLRVRFDDDALIEALELGLCDAQAVDGDEDALDFELTESGVRALGHQHPQFEIEPAVASGLIVSSATTA